MNRAKHLAIVIAALTIGLSSGIALAATPWKVLAKGEDRSDYYSSATASVDVSKPKALRIRAFGRSVKLGGSFVCTIDDRRVASGQAVVLAVPASTKCSISAYATAEDGGPLRVLIEGRK